MWEIPLFAALGLVGGMLAHGESRSTQRKRHNPSKGKTEHCPNERSRNDLQASIGALRTDYY
eukprot:2311354-Amphidinium_carterae.1